MNVPLDGLRANTVSNIKNLLQKLPGDKFMLIEPGLLRAMDRTVSMRVLSSFGVNKVFKIQGLPPEASFSKLVYVVSPSKQSVQTIIDHAEVDRKSDIKRSKLVAFVPKQTAAVKFLLESWGVLGRDLQIADLSFGWIPIDVDLVSLNYPDVFTGYFLHGDTTGPHHFGRMMVEVLESVLPMGQSPTDIHLYAFGSAAQVAAAGLSSAIGRLKDKKLVTLDSACQDSRTNASHHRPLVILFSRNLDYFSTFMVPTSFEALIHEVIGIDNGVIELPNVQQQDMVPSKLNLSSSNIASFKEVRNAHISTVHKWLQAQRSHLEDSRTGLGFSLAALDRDLPSPGQGPRIPSRASLNDLSSQLKPILTQRKELTALFICLEEVMRKMANEERVEDLLSAQTTILESGSGGALAMPPSAPPPPSAQAGNSAVAPSSSPSSSSQDLAAEVMPPESATGTCGDDPTSQPVRLALEWLSTRFGDRLTEAVRLLCLLSITHDGLSEELYTQVTRHIQHAVGFSILPMLVALRRLRLLFPRRSTPTDAAAEAPPTSTKRSALRRALAPVGREKIASATERLIRRRKSTYNRLHRQMHLSLRSQAALSVDRPAVSPSYVFGGQHTPVVVRLAESLWAQGLSTTTSANRSALLSGPELLSAEQLRRSLTLLHVDERSVRNLGRVSLDSATSSNGEVDGGAPAMRSHGQTVVVAFVGGCTYAEVAALRFAASRRCWRLLVATSQVLSTKSLIQQVGQAAAL